MNASETLHRAEASYRSAAAETTIAFGSVLGKLLKAGDVLVLTGDLGAGKTQLTKGIAAGMGITEDVCSPTFTIGMTYQGTELPLYHFDLYRLERADQLEDTGLFDVLASDGPCVIEWGEQFIDELGEERLDVLLTRMDPSDTASEPERELRFVANGARSCELLESFIECVAGNSALSWCTSDN